MYFILSYLKITIYVSVVADFKAVNFQFITKLCSKIQTLDLAQNPQLRLHLLCASNGKYSPFRRMPQGVKVREIAFKKVCLFP